MGWISGQFYHSYLSHLLLKWSSLREREGEESFYSLEIFGQSSFTLYEVII